MRTYNLHLQLAKDFHHIEYIMLMEQIENKIQIRLRSKRRTIHKKLNRLIQRQTNNRSLSTIIPTTTHKFHSRMENLTNIEFSYNEVSLLEKGFKYNLSPQDNPNNRTKHLMEIENAIISTNIEHQTDIRTMIVEKIKNLRPTLNNNNEMKTIRDLKNKIQNNNSIVTKADKGNTIVIMPVDTYNTKIGEYIEANNIVELNTDPTEQYNKDLKSLINKSTHLLNNRVIRSSKMIKPAAPILTGLPKIHKANIPIRPLINFTSAPTYSIAKYMNKWLTENAKLENDHSIKNYLELIDKIEAICIPVNAKLISLDVTNMYSNIPVAETLEITKELLIKNGIDIHTINEAIKLLKEITSQNYFTYSDKFFLQPDGLPMGSPLSGTLANIYLNHIENNHILHHQNNLLNCIYYWHRYVDDILVLFTGTNRQLDIFLNYVNNIHSKIKFTLEKEQNASINFLDLNIKNNNQRHHFKIYRKPTQTDQTIDITSNHPWQHKIAAYNHLICRLNNVPMSNVNYEEELSTIKYIAHKNGYNRAMIDTMNSTFINKMRYRQSTTLQFNELNENYKYISVEYDANTSRHINRIFQGYGYKTAYKTKHKLGQLVKPKINRSLETGVYKIKCSDCEAFYIGQTGRSFGQRFKEHIKEIGKPNCESRFALHLNNTLHNYENLDINLEVLHYLRKGKTLDRLEEFEIYRQRNNHHLLNNKINSTTNKVYELILDILQQAA